ncbi:MULTISPECIES: hypothetical protein [unclassified Erwinia]|nr:MULTISPECIES: hypothetical protein [unclassified Erwinia]
MPVSKGSNTALFTHHERVMIMGKLPAAVFFSVLKMTAKKTLPVLA